ncbi:carbohydrate ABC transporter permease [Micromonospora sp. DR5-3]|uniref:carbohydrate ABC transporter permease n=1 Tax=unclassified Micromonospora TaxID=2617518 RepID=UPI0011D8B1E5|nr:MULTISPECIES: carbohydrate ABC transporter permease [unclassified Micromonospora]MCW3818783.1 carbohydrate ABC transporter permease [Micromonospora sp. DR5-3]TYC21572.1 carbohydrate ABC transporter permease [Micromonospora sp. MP36]
MTHNAAPIDSIERGSSSGRRKTGRPAGADPALPSADGDLPRASRSRRIRPGRILVACGMVIVGLAFAFPILWMTLTAFKSTEAFLSETYPLSWKSFLPSQPTVDNFRSIFGAFGFEWNLINTAIVSAGQIVGSMVVCSLAGYAFALKEFRFRRALFAFCMIPAFLPAEALIVPLYDVVKSLGLVSTYLGLFLPFICNPFGILLMRQAFREVPRSIFEAAEMDGASEARMFLSIGLPGVKPALATLALLQFIWSWSSFFWPLVAMQDPAKQVAQVGMANFATAANTPLYGEVFAAATVLTVPVVALSIVLQRYYVKGMVSSSGR